jgi:hypothetical protein
MLVAIFMRWVVKIAIFMACFFSVAKFCKQQTGSFTLTRITSHLNFRPEWEVAPASSEELSQIRKIVDQPFSFLGKGAQSFVFASADGNYVIKFFRHHHMSTPFWLRWCRKTVAKRESKLNKDFTSYKIAYENLREETGLIFLHLNKTKHLNHTLDLVDKLGIHHPIPLDQYEFLIQKRAQLVYPALEQMMKAGHAIQAKEALTDLVHFLADRSKKGISDKDPDLNSNFGFIGTRTIQIDIGRFKQKESPLDKNEIIRITDNLHQWLMVRYPELDTHLKNQIEQL